jgi:VanZ family protein
MISYCGLMLWFMQLFPAISSGMLVGILLMLMGLSLEYLQSFTDVRTPDWQDQAANMLGVLIGWVLALAGCDRLLAWFEKRVLRR